MAHDGTKGDGSGIGVYAEFPPAPVVVKNRVDGIRAAVHRLGGWVVNELPVPFPQATRKIAILAVGSQRFIVSTNLEYRGLAINVIATEEKLGIANRSWPPFLRHVGGAPAVRPGILDSFPQGAPGTGDIGLLHGFGECSQPRRLGDTVGVKRSDKIALSGAKSGVARRREAAILPMSYQAYSRISGGDSSGVIG